MRSVGYREADRSRFTVHRGAPAEPFFVKIWITPFDA